MTETETKRRSGYTITEIAITLAIVAVAALIAMPTLNRASENNELRDTALAIDGALATARGEAIRTGDVHLFFLFEDARGNVLTDAQGNQIPIAIVNDGAPGSPRQNCMIDPGEAILTVDGEKLAGIGGVGAPPEGAGTPASDNGQGSPAAQGSSFVDSDGDESTWVMFRPDGTPIAFDEDCELGALGSGAGTFYLKNEERAYAISVSAMGTTTVARFNEATGDWD